MDKFSFLECIIKLLGLSHQEVIDYWYNNRKKSERYQPVFVYSSQARVGNYWYEDDTFSTELMLDKKVKAIVELVDGGVIYGDLTASELFDIQEKKCNWNEAKKYIEEFSYPCKNGESVCWYGDKLLKEVCHQYAPVKEAFKKIAKKYRDKYYWSSTRVSRYRAQAVNFFDGFKTDEEVAEDFKLGIRPVLMLKVS